MPLDPRIPLMVQPPPAMRDPFARSVELGQLAEQQQQLQEQQRLREADRRMREIMAQSPNDPERTLTALQQAGFGPESLKLAGTYAENRKKVADAVGSEYKTALTTIELGTQLLGAATPENYGIIRQMLSGIDGVAPLLPEQYDQAAIERLMSAGQPVKDTLEARQKSLESLRSGKDRQALAEHLATTEGDPEEYQKVLQMAPQLGFADSVIGLFDPVYSPAAVEKARSMALSEKERVEIGQKAATEARLSAADEARRIYEEKRLALAQGQLNVARGNLAVRQREADQPSRPTLTPNQALAATRSLRNDFIRETKSAQEVERQLAAMEDSLRAVMEGSAAAGSQGVLVTFQKILDPISVVRESEYARSPAGLSLISRLEGQWMRIQEGGAGVPVGELEKFVSLSREWAKNQREFTAETKRQIDGIADEYGLRKEFITRELGPPGSSETTGGAPQRSIPGVPGGVAEYRNGRWIRIK